MLHGFGAPGDDAQVVVVGQLVEQQIAHGPVRVVDDERARPRLARALDRRAHLERHVPAEDRIFVRVARIALLPRADAGRSFHVARDVEVHRRYARSACTSLRETGLRGDVVRI